MAILSGIGIENFRVFKEKMYFEFAPLTILTGANNAGKSTVLKALLLLRDSAKDNKAINKLNFKASDEHKLGNFETSKNNEKKADNISFELSFNLEKDNFLNEFIEKAFLKLDYFDSKLKWQRASFKVISQENILNNSYQLIENIADLVEKNYDVYQQKKQKEIVADDEYYGFYNHYDELENIYNIKKENGRLVVVNISSVLSFFSYNKEIEESLLYDFVTEILNPLFIKEIENGKAITGDKYYDEYGGRFNFFNNLKVSDLLDGISTPKYEKIITHIKDRTKKINSHFLDYEPTIDGWLNRGVLSVFNYFHNLELNLELTEFVNGMAGDDEFYSENANIQIANLLKFSYIPPIRANQQRLYTYLSQGTDFNQLLVRYSENDRIYREQINFINKWIGKEGFNIADEIQFIPIETYGNGVRIIKNGKRLELADLGFGITQLIPLLMQIAICEKDTYILLEEPENSLHPNLQSKLADMLIDAQRTFGVRFIIETHSEYLIRRLQILTAEKEITPDYTSIYYFYEPERVPSDKKQVEKINILPDGRLDNDFGEGFYDMAVNMKFDLLRIKNNQSKKSEKA